MRRPGMPHRAAGTPLLVVLALAQFMVVLDFTIVNVALPSIQAGLHIGTSTLQWLVSGYAVSFGGFLLLGGRLVDLFGQARMFRIGLVVFVVASVAAASPSSRSCLSVAGGAGDRRRDRRPGRALDARDLLAGGTRPQPRARSLRGGRLDRIRRGGGARRPPGAAELAAGVLRQRPGRRVPACLLLAAARLGAARKGGLDLPGRSPPPRAWR